MAFVTMITVVAMMGMARMATHSWDGAVARAVLRCQGVAGPDGSAVAVVITRWNTFKTASSQMIVAVGMPMGMTARMASAVPLMMVVTMSVMTVRVLLSTTAARNAIPDSVWLGGVC